jgi:putative transposase
MAIRKELLDELLDGYQQPADLMGENGVLKRLTQALIERVLEGELTHHLGYEKHSPEGKHSGNSRNGKTHKRLKGQAGEIPLAVPRDRQGEFEPQFIKKRQTRCSGFDDKIIALSARGLTVREEVSERLCKRASARPAHRGAAFKVDRELIHRLAPFLDRHHPPLTDIFKAR